MKMTINGLEVEIQEEADGVSFKIRSGQMALSQTVAPAPQQEKETVHQKVSSRLTDLEVLDRLGLSMKSILQTANKVLGFRASKNDVGTEFPKIKKASMSFLRRPLKDPIWALFLCPIKLPMVGGVAAAVGLNAENQLTILGYDSTFPELFDGLVARGLKAKGVKLGVFSFEVGDKGRTAFEKAFPQAEIGLDWYEFRNNQKNDKDWEVVNSAMALEKESEIKKLVSKFKPAPELFAFLSYEKDLWRALRSTAPLKRIEEDLRQRIKPVIVEEDQAEFAIAWCLMRLQFYWIKIPADAEQLKELKYP